MFNSINEQFNAKKNREKDDQMILESVMEDEILNDEEDDEELVDGDSIPQDIYAEVDKALDKVVERQDFDDMEIEELLDDDDDEDDSSISATLEEAVTKGW